MDSGERGNQGELTDEQLMDTLREDFEGQNPVQDEVVEGAKSAHPFIKELQEMGVTGGSDKDEEVSE